MYSYVRAVQQGRLDLPGFIHEAKRAGAEGVELLSYFYKDVAADRAKALAALAETGLPCPIFSISQNFAKTSAAERSAELDKIKFGVDEAGYYGAGVVRVFAGDVSPGISFEEARDWIVEGLTAAAEYAHKAGVRLALENHGKLAGRGDQVRELVGEVRLQSGCDAFGANPDTGNFMLVNQPSHEAIEQVAPYAYMVHFKDFRSALPSETEQIYTALDGSRWVGTAVGEGEVNLGACISALRDAGFDGWLSVEYEGVEDPFTAVPRSIANARQYL